MTNITKEHARVKTLLSSHGDDFICNPKFQDDREWMVLCESIVLLKNSTIFYPEYAIKLTPPADQKQTPQTPDFQTYTKSFELFNPVEITEILTPGRKRNDEYKNCDVTNGNIDIEPVLEPWQSFIAVVNKKLNKKYEINNNRINNGWLIAYHNMFYNDIKDAGDWRRLVNDNFQEFINNGSITMEAITKSSFERIFIINSSFSQMIQLFPKVFHF